MKLFSTARTFYIPCPAWILGLAAALTASPASAVFLDFEDLPTFYLETADGSVIYTDKPEDYGDKYDPEDFQALPVARQYEDQGVIFGDFSEPFPRSLGPGAGDPTGPAALVSAPVYFGDPRQKFLTSFYYDPYGIAFQFTGDKLPNYVSFYLWAPNDVAKISLYGPGESEGPDESAGDFELLQNMPLGYEVDSAGNLVRYTDDEIDGWKIELFGDQIRGVMISNYFGGQKAALSIDDLTFTYAEVPEPGSLALMVGGLVAGAGVSLRRRRK